MTKTTAAKTTATPVGTIKVIDFVGVDGERYQWSNTCVESCKVGGHFGATLTPAIFPAS